MSLIYVPHRIDTLEQAKQLPTGTIAMWSVLGEISSVEDAAVYDAEDLVGTTALTPVEVEVEHLRTHTGMSKTLYVTDWTQEEA